LQRPRARRAIDTVMTDTDLPRPAAEAVAAPRPGPVARAVHALMVLLEQSFLIGVAVLTVYVAWLDLTEIFAAPEPGAVVERLGLAQVLQFFLYAEVVAMVAVFFTRSGSLFTFPLFIAITALARLMVIEGKDIPPESFVYRAGAILLLSIAIAVLSRVRRN
jgi:protein PsiE